MSDFYPIIQKPCRKDWDSLSGDERRRFCGECQHHVHNLSAMTRAEQYQLLKVPGRHCVSYPVATETVRVRLGKWMFLSRIRAFGRLGYAVAAVVVSLFVTGCATTSRKDSPALPPPAEAQGCSKDDGKAFMTTTGVIYVPRPLWQRILWPF